MLLRLLLIFLICYIISKMLRSIAASRRGGISSKPRPDLRGEEMVLDPQCQSYISKSDAIAVSGRYFCSRECAQLYLSR
jgi:uncharacterized protein